MLSRWIGVCSAIWLITGAGPGSGITGNDTGGIIPWSPLVEAGKRAIVADYCARYNKYPRITSDHPHYGDYIAFACVWSPHARP